MDIDLFKDFALIFATGVVSILGIIDRRNAGKAKDAQIELLQARIKQLQEDQSPQAFLNNLKARLEIAEQVAKYAQEDKEKMNKEHQERIEKLHIQIAELETIKNTLSKVIPAGTAAWQNISGSPLFQEFAEKNPGFGKFRDPNPLPSIPYYAPNYSPQVKADPRVPEANVTHVVVVDESDHVNNKKGKK